MESRTSSFKSFWPELAVFLLAAFLILNFLDSQMLWQDEAETAMLAKSVLRYGYPRAYYGDYLINPAILPYGSFGPGEAWVYHTWLPFYLTAASFKVFGFTTWAARFPFALLGLASIVLIYFLVLELFENRAMALLSAFMSTTSVPLCLLLRQCRYYAPQLFFVFSSLYMYVLLRKSFSVKKLWLLTLSNILLFHATWGFFVPVALWITFDFFVFRRYANWPRYAWRHLAAALILVIPATLPWFFFCHPEHHSAALTFVDFRKNIEFSIRVINKYIFPFVINAILFVILVMKTTQAKNKLREIAKQEWFRTVGSFLVINTVFIFFLRHRMMRYYIHLFPFYYTIQALILFQFSRKISRWGAVVLFLFIHFTTIPGDSAQYLVKNVSSFKEATKFYFLDYLYEITHRYEGPVSSAVDYLKKNAKPGDTIKVPTAAEPESFQFYLPDQKVSNGRFFANQDFPEWIVPRDYWVRQELKLFAADDLAQKESYLTEIGKRYERIVLDTFDIVWENRPDELGYHKFKTVSDGLYRTMIYRRLSEEELRQRNANFIQEKVKGSGFDRQPLIPTYQ